MNDVYSYTLTETFTLTHARYLASKVAADLRQMQRFYGRPSDEDILNYITELAILLVGGYLDSVEYGFRRSGDWIVAVGYKVLAGGSLSDDRPGRVPPGVDIAGATWYSYLRHSPAWWSLSEAEKQRIRDQLPFSRSSAPEPGTGGGHWSNDRSYSREGVSLQRSRFEVR